MDVISNLSGYAITEQLYAGQRTLVYRGVRDRDQLPVVIKLLRNEFPSFNELVQFRNQYAIAKTLNSPNIITTYGLEPYNNSYALIMEDFGGVSLKEWAIKRGTELSLQDFLRIVISLSDTLNTLNINNVIHKDIKPANILVNPDTKQVKLIDFSIASLLPRENIAIQNVNNLEGTLAYLSPEQTGRMNRGIDYRSDFYSFGVTLYELLTKRLPFAVNDPMELVHCHLAKNPIPVHELNADIPLALSEIIHKLMAKNAEDRYQSALGIKHDLEICLEQLQSTGEIKSFKLGQRDLSDRFHIPEKLYGRQGEVETLLNAFERVSQGSTELMLVAGFSGIGKTAVVNEVHKPIVKQRGYFIKGKFDQFQRNIPFSAFVQAFRDLMGQLLSESDTQLETWKSRILGALGDNAQVMIEVIPELVLILGSQPPAVELSGTAAQNRFNLLFQKFFRVFTTQEHPLVLFIDDLQWADLASLSLMQLLLGDAETKYLLFLGAYRDNEVSPVHPFMLTLGELQKLAVRINRINLMPLSRKSIGHLVADTLNCSTELAIPLTELVMTTAKGNPFFSTRLLRSLYEEGLIRFDHQERCWLWDRTATLALTLTEDVVEFMAQQLQKLPRSTQDVLKLAACIGAEFDLATLAIVSQKSEVEVSVALWEALQEELILPLNQVYRFFQDGTETLTMPQSVDVPYQFLHDRVQQAAYSLIPDDQKQAVHLKIGQLLFEYGSQEEKTYKIFEVVNHLNIGSQLITDPAAIIQLGELNFTAGQQAKLSTAYTSSVSYFQKAINLLTINVWQNDYALALSLYGQAMEVNYLSGDFIMMNQLLEEITNHTRDYLDLVKVQEISIEALVAQGKLLEAVGLGLEVLEQLEINFPEQPTPEDYSSALASTQLAIGNRQPEELIDLPLATDKRAIAALRILGKVATPVYLTTPSLYPLIIYRSTELSVYYGVSSASTFLLVAYGLINCAMLDDYANGYGFGQLAIALSLKLEDQEFRARVLLMTGHFVAHWKVHLRETLPLLKSGYSIGLESGDSAYAAYSVYVYSFHAYFSGYLLSELVQELGNYRQVLQQLSQYAALNYQKIYHQTVLNLLGESAFPNILLGSIYNEREMLPKHQASKDYVALAHLFINKLVLSVWFENWEEAIEAADLSESYLASALGMATIPIYYFYDSLARLASVRSRPEQLPETFRLKIEQSLKKLENWAEVAPMNHQHKVDLVEAERYRVLGSNYEAGDRYDRAIAGAKENEYIQEEALANELAAKFYLDWGKEKVAASYMQEAYYGYARWGAKAKVHDLETRYPQLLQPILQLPQTSFSILETLTNYSVHSSAPSSAPSSSSSISDAMDFAAILQAAQALSSTINLDHLLTKFTEILLQNSGADKCVLVLPHQETWLVKAIATTEGTTLCSEPLDEHPHLPVKLIQYVKRTQSMVLVDNLETDLPVIDDYLSQRQPKSLLGLPILNQRKLVGILYLRNRSTPGVFTSDRILVINFLCAQAAISLENARLYQQAQAYAQQLEQSQLQVIQSEKMSALGNLVAGVAHEINNPVGFLKGNITPALDYVNDLFGLLDLVQEKHPQLHPEVREEMEAIDLEYIREDLPKLIGSMKTGVDRIRDISISLRTFSRADSDRPVACNIHDGIDSTIMILKHRLKGDRYRPEIQVIKEYGDLPQVECFAGQLNQVFMNIFANAIDAIEESNQGLSYKDIAAKLNRIIVRTSLKDDQLVEIRIIDNGNGMSEEVRTHIFDHLFTTKGVGKGTGLGLAIAQQIVVEKHHGQIIVNSEIDVGTEFIVLLPIR